MTAHCLNSGTGRDAMHQGRRTMRVRVKSEVHAVQPNSLTKYTLGSGST